MQRVPVPEDVYDWIERRIANGDAISHAIEYDGVVYLAIPVFPELSEGSLIEDIGFRLSADGKTWKRCLRCRGVSRVDCCDRIDCERCRGLFTAWCTECEAGRRQIAIDDAEREFLRSC